MGAGCHLTMEIISQSADIDNPINLFFGMNCFFDISPILQ